MTVPAWHTLNTLHSQPLPFNLSLRKGLEDSHGTGSRSTRAHDVHTGFPVTLCSQQSMLRQSGSRSHHLFMAAIWLLRDWEELNASKRTLYSTALWQAAASAPQLLYLFLKCSWKESVALAVVSTSAARWGCRCYWGSACAHAGNGAEGLPMIPCWLIWTSCIYWYFYFCFCLTLVIPPPTRFSPLSCFIIEFTVLQMEKWCWTLINDHLWWSNEWLRCLITSINTWFWLPLKDPVLLWYHTIDCCLWWKQR